MKNSIKKLSNKQPPERNGATIARNTTNHISAAIMSQIAKSMAHWVMDPVMILIKQQTNAQITFRKKENAGSSMSN